MAKAAQGYEKQHPRINKPDMFIITALMMERSPQAQRPNSFVPVPESTARGDDDQSASSRQKAVTKETVGKETSKVQGDDRSGYQDASAQNKPVAQETEVGKGTTEVQGDGQSSGKDSSDQEKPVAQESEPRKCNKSGAVVVLPNDRALSVDCSQEGVHAAVSALNKFGQERVKGCQVYLSRRPCSYCAKLLVQCEVAKVYYLPIEPELNDKEDVQRVDKLFKASSTGLSVFIPKVSETVINGVKARTSPYLGTDESPNREAIKRYKKYLIQHYWSDEWVRKAKHDLEWPAFDENMQKQTKNDIKKLMKWIARATFGDVPDRDFLEINPKTLEGVQFQTACIQGPEVKGTSEYQDEGHSGYKDASAGNKPVTQETQGGKGTSSELQEDGQSSGKDLSAQKNPVTQEFNPSATTDSESSQNIEFRNFPTPTEPNWQRHALHMVRMAQMLSQRSDDPSKPVGCILMVHGEVVAIGWNGFPAKALYGEFPRASSTDQASEKKEPYVIHAEQNALLTRNKRNMKHGSSILYSNKIPCGECVPLLIQAGVKNVVVPCEPGVNNIENKAFLTALKNDKLKGYWPARQEKTDENEEVEREKRDKILLVTQGITTNYK